MTAKKTTKKSPAKKTTKKVVAKKATTKSTKASAKVAKKSPAKKTAKKAAAKATTKAAAKSTAKSGSKRAAATKKAAPAATKKASNSSAKKATAKKNVAQSKTASAAGSAKKNQKDKTPVIPPEYGYLHDKKWLESQREALLRERASYTSSADRLAAEAAALMADREPGDVQFDEESGEGDTIAVERDRDLALSAAARQSVSDIDAALERLDNNTYGMCTAGDDIIPQERLEAIPEASVCVTHKTSMF